jgi:hypothetical protein
VEQGCADQARPGDDSSCFEGFHWFVPRCTASVVLGDAGIAAGL